MATTEAEVTGRVFEALVKGRGSAKEAAIRAIDDPQTRLNHEYLRTVLLKSLRNDFPTNTTDPKSNDTRGWLLSALGRVCADEGDPSAEAMKHLHPNEEPLEWVRYWTLEGLIAGNAKDLRALA